MLGKDLRNKKECRVKTDFEKYQHILKVQLYWHKLS